ncbi:MAG: hypothetical protein ACFFBP_11715 [Promethearchaeota archaeon]
MPKCPYCKTEINLEDFFEIKEKVKKKGNIKKKYYPFKGQSINPFGFTPGNYKKWSCPSCDSILGFSEY